MYLFQKIEEMMLEYNDARRNIGEFILNNKDNILNYSMQEIADLTFTSKATLVRFAKALGYNGWKEFIKVFTEESYYKEASGTYTDPNFPFAEGDTSKAIISSLKNLHIESIMDTADLLDTKTLDRAVDIMYSAERIVIYGMSPNIYNGYFFRRKMLSIGKSVIVGDNGEAGMLSRTLNSKDCAIIIGYSGNNANVEPMCNIKYLKERNVQIIGITSGGNNYLRESSDCVFTMSSREKLYSKIANFATDESIAFILNTLFSCYFVRDYKKNIEFKIHGSELLEKQRQAALKSMMEKEEF